jgi:hypothetical protein
MTKIEIVNQLIVAEAELKAAQKVGGQYSKVWQKAYELRKAAGVDPCRPYGSKANPNLLNIR